MKYNITPNGRINNLIRLDDLTRRELLMLSFLKTQSKKLNEIMSYSNEELTNLILLCLDINTTDPKDNTYKKIGIEELDLLTIDVDSLKNSYLSIFRVLHSAPQGVFNAEIKRYWCEWFDFNSSSFSFGSYYRLCHSLIIHDYQNIVSGSSWLAIPKTLFKQNNIFPEFENFLCL